MSYPHMEMDSMRLSHSPDWVGKLCDSLNEIICTHGGSHGGYTLSAEELETTGELSDIQLCNSWVSRRGGGRPGRPSSMLPGFTWILAGEEAYYEPGCTSYIHIISATANDNLPASKPVVWNLLLRLGDYIGLLNVFVESITIVYIGARYWTGEQRGVEVVVVEGHAGGKPE